MKLLLVLALFAFKQCAAMSFTDCATDPSNTAFTVHELDLSPNPILFPGDLTISLNATVNRAIDHLFIDVELYKKTIAGLAKVPCVAGTSIGSCTNIDACGILPDILSGNSVVSSDLGKQIDAILLAALGHQAHCPIQPEQVSLQGQVLHLKALPTLLSSIGDGTYTIKIMVKEDPTSPDNVGCLQFTDSIKRAPTSGFLFN